MAEDKQKWAAQWEVCLKDPKFVERLDNGNLGHELYIAFTTLRWSKAKMQHYLTEFANKNGPDTCPFELTDIIYYATDATEEDKANAKKELERRMSETNVAAFLTDAPKSNADSTTKKK